MEQKAVLIAMLTFQICKETHSNFEQIKPLGLEEKFEITVFNLYLALKKIRNNNPEIYERVLKTYMTQLGFIILSENLTAIDYSDLSDFLNNRFVSIATEITNLQTGKETMPVMIYSQIFHSKLQIDVAPKMDLMDVLKFYSVMGKHMQYVENEIESTLNRY